MSPIFTKLDVAIHEAGHAVCNHFFGRATAKIVLTFKQDLNEWHGGTHAVPPKDPVRIGTNFSFGSSAPVESPDFSPLAAECVIAAAGYFAQVLKTGRELRPDLLLSVIQDWPSLLDWLHDKQLVTEKPEFPMAVTSCGNLMCLAIPPRAFSTGDQRAYCRVRDHLEMLFPKEMFPREQTAFENLLIDNMGRFMGFLNKVETSKVLCEIAAILVSSEESPAVFEGEGLAQALARLGVA